MLIWRIQRGLVLENISGILLTICLFLLKNRYIKKKLSFIAYLMTYDNIGASEKEMKDLN